jgi:hypothetical protein
MKNATYVDQCDAIRTLTDEDMAVVSGGQMSPMMRALANGTYYGSPAYERFQNSGYTYPSNYNSFMNSNSSSSVNFLEMLYSRFSSLSQAGFAIWNVLQ